MAKKENDVTYILDSKKGLPNKLLQADGSITDMVGNTVINPDEAWDSKPALPNKWLNPDGTYSTLNEIIASVVDTGLYVVVDELPAEGDPQKIYLVPDGKGGFVEYHWTGSKWDPIGMVEFDISNYSTTQEMMNAIEAALNTAKSYTDTELTDYVKNTDYATDNKGGTFKTKSSLATFIGSGNNAGNLACNIFQYNNYENLDQYGFVSKGTLENVITGKQLVNQTDLDTAIQTSITQVLGGSY